MSDGRTYWDRHAARYDRATRFLSPPVPRMLDLVRAAAAGKARVLEVAAGTGLVTTAIAPVVCDLTATDYSSEMIKQLEMRIRDAGLANVHLAQADIYDLQYDAGTFDTVFAANVLHLVSDLPRALASLRRVLKPDGVLIAPTYLHGETLFASVLSRVFAMTGFPGERRFSAHTLATAIVAADFRVLRAETLPGPFPIGYVEAVPV